MNKILIAILIITGLSSPVYADRYTIYTDKDNSGNSIYFNYDEIRNTIPGYSNREILGLVQIIAQYNNGSIPPEYASIYVIRAPFAATELYWLNDHGVKDCTSWVISWKSIFDINYINGEFPKIPQDWDLSFLNRHKREIERRDESNPSKPVMDYLYKKSFNVKH